jgi:hypothetical protein
MWIGLTLAFASALVNESHLEQNAAADHVQLNASDLSMQNNIPVPVGSRY